MKVIITGTTGMVGRGALLECIDNPKISDILIVNRRTINIQNPKVKEIILPDFWKINQIEKEFADYDLCIHCIGISAAGLKEEQYRPITFDLTMAFADAVYRVNPNITFCYVSGAGTDTSMKGCIMWARVKGETENYILNKGFKDAYAFRPGGILPEKGIKSKTNWYNIVYDITRPLFPLLEKSRFVTTTSKLGKAFIAVGFSAQSTKRIENRQINKLSKLS